MATYRTVYLQFWTDPKVDDEFTPEDKYFYLYLITNPHTNICGCYEIGEKQCSRETGYNQETVSRLLKRFQDAHDVIRYNPATKEVLILNWHKYNWTSSKDLMKSVRNVAENIKCDEFREYIFALIDSDSETVPTPSPHPVGTSDTVSVTDTVSVRKNIKREVFKEPTVEEVKAYCKERNNSVDPEYFIDFYTSKGWKVGNQPMKDWKAAVRTWEKGDKNGRTQSVHGKSTEHDKKPQYTDADLRHLYAT